MEADWQELVRIGVPPPAINHPPTPTAVLSFDNNQELLWIGNEYGRVTSFYGPELQRYTSYRGNNVSEGPVRQILPCEKGILSLGSRSVHLGERRGRALWHLTHDLFHDLKCMSFSTRGPSEILVAGCQTQMFTVDIEKGTVVEILPAPDHYTLMKRGGQYICAATASGSVQLLDPKTFEVLKSWKAHMGWINDMDANSTFLVTCGFAPRHNYGNMPEPLAKVFDLKTLLPLPPVPFHSGAVLVRMHPRMQTTGVIASQTGQLQVVDIMNTAMVNVRQINLMDSYLIKLDIAPSGETLALTDSMCSVHLWGSPSKIHFTNYSNPTEFADNIPHEANLDWSSGRPLNTVGMPYYRDTLLSAWPTHLISEVGARSPKLDQLIASNLTRTDIGAWAPNPRKKHRNQVEDTRSSEKAIAAAIEGPKFLSEQAKDGSTDDQGRRMSEVLEAINVANVDETTKVDVPIMYRNVEIKYSKFGVEDFDFEYYNKTRFSGLETHISNSYANSLLQLLKFTPLLRNLALHHTASSCLSETCMLCELGFLFDMLEKAQGQNCQATNLLKTFSGLSGASGLHLLEEASSARPLTMMIQAMNRFLLDKIVTDFKSMSPHSQTVDHILATSVLNNVRCPNCGSDTVRGTSVYHHQLEYPPRTPNKGHARNQGPAFSQVLKYSVERQEQARGWCDRCKRYQQMNTRKSIQNVPPVLMLNAGVMTMDARQLFNKPNWLPQEIGIINEQGQFFCYEGQDLKVHLQRGVYNILVYELIGIVADIYAGDNHRSHLVSMINVSPSMSESQEENSWHLFNDFMVRKVPADEALKFDPSWKLPSVLTYQLKRYRHQIDHSWQENLDTSLLYRQWVASQENDSELFQTLSYPTERPRPGTPVGIDAEFVSLQQEELEIKADGTRHTLRPSRLALARVSVLRGGPEDQALAVSTENDAEHGNIHAVDGLAYVPFVDDYIHIQEPIIDYLTAFSGIRPGDLDPHTSPYVSSGRLVSLKMAYKKIWLLLNLGCVFVGHGLPKDFRTINIHIPKNQVVDTVELFFIKSRQRKLSLRFLSWYLLGEVVQATAEEGNEGKGHDSVEDARTALKLWGVWKKLEADGKIEAVVEDIYNRGRHVQFKVPLTAAGGRKGMDILASTGMRGGKNSDTPRSGTPVMPGEYDEGRSAPGTPAGRSAGLVNRVAIVESPEK